MAIKEMKVGIVGSGAMGSGIAQVAAMAGQQVLIYDNSLSARTKSKANVQASLTKLSEKGKLSKADAAEIFKRIQYVTDFKSLKQCNLIIEAIVEDLCVKQKLFSELELIVSNDCILATNTSSLSITSIASTCKNPGRVIGLHFFNPPTLMALVEVVPGIVGDSTMAAELKKTIDSWGKLAVIAKDTPGFIVNRVARSFYGEAVRVYEEGMADFATIDWAMKEFGGFKMGPFELMDLIGNDVNYKVTETVWKQMSFDQRFKPSVTQRRMVEAGFFGRKTSRGYYNYASGAAMPKPVKDEKLGKEIFHRILFMLINEAADALYFQVASREDIDLAMKNGVNYPKGLLKWADEIGVKKVYEALQLMYDEYAEDRYRPSVLLKRMAKNNQTFF